MRKNLIPPGILAVGVSIWRLLSHASTFDFVLSIGNQGIAGVLSLFENGGWLILFGIGMAWLIVEFRRPAQQTINVIGLAASIGTIAFLFGLFYGAKMADPPVAVIEQYGVEMPPPTCTATVNTERFRIYWSDYNLALFCGLNDPTVNKLDDPNISISVFMNMEGPRMQIAAIFSTPMMASMQASMQTSMQQRNVQGPLSVWHAVALIPKSVRREQISSLGDVQRVDGKLMPTVRGSDFEVEHAH